MKRSAWVLVFGVAMGSVACTPKEKAPPPSDPAALVARGKAVYAANCVACHGTNPGVDGALGPAITGSDLALLERRVVHGDYPEGYKPKRSSRLMVAIPHLKDDLKALHAYLNSGSM